jgi:hypothetical protein
LLFSEKTGRMRRERLSEPAGDGVAGSRFFFDE